MGDITNHVSTLEQRSIGRDAVNLLYYFFCNFRIQILWQGWETNEWVQQSERHRLHTEGGREDRRERERKMEEAVAMEMMIILDMLRWRFVLPQRRGYKETYTNTARTMCG